MSKICEKDRNILLVVLVICSFVPSSKISLFLRTAQTYEREVCAVFVFSVWQSSVDFAMSTIRTANFLVHRELIYLRLANWLCDENCSYPAHLYGDVSAEWGSTINPNSPVRGEGSATPLLFGSGVFVTMSLNY